MRRSSHRQEYHLFRPGTLTAAAALEQTHYGLLRTKPADRKLPVGWGSLVRATNHPRRRVAGLEVFHLKLLVQPVDCRLRLFWSGAVCRAVRNALAATAWGSPNRPKAARRPATPRVVAREARLLRAFVVAEPGHMQTPSVPLSLWVPRLSVDCGARYTLYVGHAVAWCACSHQSSPRYVRQAGSATCHGAAPGDHGRPSRSHLRILPRLQSFCATVVCLLQGLTSIASLLMLLQVPLRKHPLLGQGRCPTFEALPMIIPRRNP